ncbi:MAG: oligosaccharide flippase family protein [Planctomycetota bacterium]
MSDPRLMGLLLRGGIASGAGAVTSRVLHALAYAILARLLTATAFGEMSLASIVINALALFPALGLGTALLAERRDPRELAPAALSLSALSGAALVLVSLAMAPFVTRLYGATVGGLVAVIGLTLGFRSVSAVTSALLDREFRFHMRALVEGVEGAAFLGVAVALAVLGMGSAAIAWGLVAASVATAVLQWAATRVRPAWSFARFRELSSTAGVGFVVLLTTILGWVFVSALPLLVEHRFGREVLGMYSLAFFVAMLPATGVGFLSGRLALPALVRAREQGIDAAEPFLRVTRLAALIAAACTVLFALAPRAVVLVLYGEAKVEAAAFLPLLAVYSYARVLGGLAGPVLLATGRARVALGLVFVQDLVALPAALCISAERGPEALVFVFTVTAAAACLSALLIAARALGGSVRAIFTASLLPLVAIGAPGVALGALAGEGGRFAGIVLGIAVGAILASSQWSRLGARSLSIKGEML